MGDNRREKHKDFVEPGSEKDRELAEILNGVLDGWAMRSKERHRREAAAAERDRQRRADEGLPVGDDCYFVRFTGGMYVRDEDLSALWEADRIAVHLAEGESTLLRLSERGGYVWFEGRSGKEAKVGVVRPGTQVEASEACWSDRYNPKYRGKAGTPTVLRTLQLEKVRSVGPGEAMTLRASRPVMPDHVGGNLEAWDPACGKFRLVSIVETGESGSPRIGWNDLPLPLQMTVCVDFLRDHDEPGYPKLKRVLLTPTFGPDKDVDIYGLAEDGTEIFAQVPFRRNRDREGFEARKKAGQLMRYRGTGARLICITPGHKNDEEDRRLFGGRLPVVLHGVLFIPVGEILEWVEGQPGYAEKLLSA